MLLPKSYSAAATKCNFQPKLRGWWTVDIWSGWPVNPGLTQDRPISLLSARLKIQSSQWKVSKFSNWPLTWFGIADHLFKFLYQPDNRVTWHNNKIRDFVNNSKFVFDISSYYFPPNIIWYLRGSKVSGSERGERGIDQRFEDPSKIHPPLPGPGHPLKTPRLSYPLVSLEKPPLGILRIPLSRANKWILDPVLLLRWLLKIITLNQDLQRTLFRTNTLAKKTLGHWEK